jgi:hypothetical protein
MMWTGNGISETPTAYVNLKLFKLSDGHNCANLNIKNLSLVYRIYLCVLDGSYDKQVGSLYSLANTGFLM